MTPDAGITLPTERYHLKESWDVFGAKEALYRINQDQATDEEQEWGPLPVWQECAAKFVPLTKGDITRTPTPHYARRC